MFHLDFYGPYVSLFVPFIPYHERTQFKMLAGLKIEAEVYVPLMLHGLCALSVTADDYIKNRLTSQSF